MRRVRKWLLALTINSIGGLPLFSVAVLASSTTKSMHADESKYDSAKIAQTLTLHLTTHYIEFHYSKDFTELDTLKARVEAYDKFCDDVVRELNVSPPKSRIKCFVYSSSEEMQRCAGIDGGGWALINEIHTLGLFPIQHECFHILFNGAIGHPKSVFFIEGIGQYFELSRDSQMVRRDLGIVRKYLTQPIELWANGTKHFWESPHEDWITVTYSISGIFVRHLIQKFGLVKFKEFYRVTDDNTPTATSDGFRSVYGCSLGEFISDFSEHIRSMP